MDVAGGFASHNFTTGENVTFSSTSDLGQGLEVSDGVVQFGVGDTPSGSGYGLLIDQAAYLQMDTNGVMYIAGPLVVGNSQGVTAAHADLSGNSSLHVGTVSGTDQTLYVGKQGTGTVSQYGSAAVYVPTLDLGYVSGGGNGSYSLSGNATLNVAQNEIIGDHGIGTFAQTGGTDTVGGSLIITNNAFGVGTVNANGGTMQVTGNAYVGGNSSGAQAVGILNVTGGNVAIAGSLTLYYSASPDLNLSSGTLSTGTINFNSYNLSTLNWTGGTLHLTGEPVDFPGNAADPYNSHPFGTSYYLNQGTLQVDSFEWVCGSTGYLNISTLAINSCPNVYVGSSGVSSSAQFILAGTLDSTNEFIGYIDSGSGVGGNGTFSQSNGINAATNVDVGYNSTGSYTLSGGTLASNNVSVSANGTFDQSGGTLFFGSFNQSGGTATFDPGMTLSGNTYTLSAGTANFTRSGTTLAITNVAGTSFSFTGGTLNANYIGNSATFSWTGGTLNILSYLDVTNIADPTNHATFGNSLTLNSAKTLDVTSYEWLYGAGSSVNQSGGSNTTATLQIGNNNATGQSSMYTLSGGTLTTDTVEIGYISGSSGSGAGNFSQTAGTNSTKFLIIGYNGSTGGNYNLSGSGTLSVHDDLIVGYGATGLFNQSGGTTTIGTFVVEAHTGTATVSLGSLTANITNNSGTITQTGGTTSLGNVTGTGTISVGNASGAVHATMTVSSLTQNSVNILSTGLLQITGGTTNTVKSLSITGNGKLDITNAGLIINYGTGTDPIASIEQWIENGYYALSGPSIISGAITTDDSTSGYSYGIGYADGADGVVAGLPSGEIEIMFTLLGDANLDGTVNSEDFSPFSHNLGQSGVMWDDGDFNYDGTVNSEDFSAFSHNLGQSAVLAGVLDADAIDLANVPEPAIAAMLVMAGLGILRRRRRNRSKQLGKETFAKSLQILN